MATSPVLFVYYPPLNDDSYPGVPNRHITEDDWASFTIAQRRTIENATTQEGYTRRNVWVHIDLVDETEEERAQREAEEAAARAEYDRKNSLVRYGQIESMIDQLEVLPPAEEFAALRQDVDAVADVPPRVDAVETALGGKADVASVTAITPGPGEVIVGSADGPVARDVSEIGGGSVATFSANTFGADPDATWETNRDAFQAANDAAFAAGGGRVVAKPGVYDVKGIEQDSHVEFYLPNVTLRSPDGAAPDVIRSRVLTTTGNGSGTSVTVQSGAALEVGGVVAVEHAGGILDSQWSYLTEAIDATQTTGIILQGKSTSWRPWGVLQIGNELIQHTGYNSTTGEISGVTRGVLGTTASAHTTAERIGVARHLYAIVTAVDGNVVTLDRPLIQAVTGATVHVGAIRPMLTDVTVDGGYIAGSPVASVYGVSWPLVRWGHADNLSVRNCGYGGLMLLKSTADSSFRRVKLHNCGIPSESRGAALWFYQGASRNLVEDLSITGDAYIGIYADDRTTYGDPWDAPSNDNTVRGLLIDITEGAVGGPAAISITACNRNRFLDFTVKGARRGFSTARTHQGYTPDDSLPHAIGNEFSSFLVDVAGQPWGVLSPGNFVHDGWFTDRASEQPVVDAGSFVYAARMTLGGGLVGPAFENGSGPAPAIRLASDPDTGFWRYAEDTWAWSAGGVRRITLYPTQLRLEDGVHLEVGTGAGSRIGFSPTRKLAFWGGTPRVQPSAIPDTTGSDVAALEDEVNKLKALLRSIGLMAS